MYKIIEKEKIAESIFSITIGAPKIAVKRKAGQFVVLITDEKGERVPLTIAGSDRDKGTIDIVFQAVGHTTKLLATLEPGDCIKDILGPLGHPTHIENFGTAVCIGGGLGIALAMPITEALHEAGNNVISIISARNESLLLMEDRLREISNELLIATDDGSKGFHGFPTQILQEMIDNKKKVDIVFAVGPVPLMGAVCKVTKPYNIKTIVSLNPIMVDATGMCGACRVEVGGKTKFACVDGPEFDGHEVDFGTLMKRLKVYTDSETDDSRKDAQAEECKMDEEKTETYKKIEEDLLGQQTVLKKIDIKTEALVCIEIYLDNIKEMSKKLKDQKNQYQYSDFQKSERDFAFVIDKNFKVQDLVNIISEIDKNLIRSVKVFDVYEGENIPDDKKSIALNVVIQSSEKTLNDGDLEKINQLIISTVESKSGAKIRS